MEEKKKILIIDDDSFLLDMYALKFSQSGFSVETALGSDIALQKIEGGLDPDAMLMDIVMPGMNGFELLKKIRDENKAPHSVIIMLSNRGQENDIKEAKSLGVAGYIVKANSTPSEVIARVTEMMKEHHN